VYQERIRRFRKSESPAFERSTANALEQLEQMVPRMIKSNAVGWQCTPAGKIVAESQLGARK
jgi:hypothetical protein